MKKIFRNLLILIGLFILLLFIGPVFSTNPLINWRYYQRFVTFPRSKPVTSVAWYEPMVTIHGSDMVQLRLANRDEVIFDQDALNKSSDYAEKNNSSNLLIIQNKKIILEKYWQNASTTSTSDSASMAKTVVALLIGIAINEGKIKSEDEPVANYIPEWKNDERSKITIKNMMQMASGLRKYDNLYSPFSDLVKMHIGFNLPDVVLNIPAHIAPDTEFEYNNANSQILSILLEKATNTKYYDYLAKKLWQPLKLEDAQIWLDHPEGTARTYCCLFADARDWGRIGQLLMDKGKFENQQIVPQQWIEKMLKPSKVKPNYGYQIWLGDSKEIPKERLSEPFLVNDMFFLDGRSKQRVYVVPSEKLIIVRIGENPEQWDEGYIINTLIRGLKKPVTTKVE